MSSPDDQNLGETDDLKKTIVEDFEKGLEISDDTEVDLEDDEKTAEGSGCSSSSALNASEDKGDEDDEAPIAEYGEADEEKENPISNVEEITGEGGRSTLNLSEDMDEKKSDDSENRQDDGVLIAKSDDEADEEKENPISIVQEITEEEGGSSSLDISEEKGKKKISDSVDQQDDDLLISKSDEADEEERNPGKLRAIGTKIATAGCFVDGGDSVLLAHDDGSCSLYDAANFQEKLEFESDSPTRNLFRDCWVVKTDGPNQESEKYVVATSSGNRQYLCFYSWDFESGQIQTGYVINRSDMESFFGVPSSPISAWWHSPSDHLVAVALATLKRLTIYDVRDFEDTTEWDLPEPVCPLQHTSPLQWRDKGKIVIAHPTEVAFLDINGPTDHAQVLTCGFARDEKVCALHVTNLNPDAETGGIRQRASASPEAPEGVVCTSHSVFVLDSRKKDGTGMRMIRTDGLRAHSVYCDSRSFYMGCDNLASSANNSYVQHYSLRSARLVGSYGVRPANGPPDDDVRSVAVRQVWGGSGYVMGMSRSGLHVFDSSDDMSGGARFAREVLGCGDEAVVRHPSFDVEGSRVLLVNGHGPAQWKTLV